MLSWQPTSMLSWQPTSMLSWSHRILPHYFEHSKSTNASFIGIPVRI
jgi:hypothetical protein